MDKLCAGCDKVGVTRCSRCHKVGVETFYCGSVCQTIVSTLLSDFLAAEMLR